MTTRLVIATFLMLLTAAASAADPAGGKDAISRANQACAAERAQFCSQVTPGEGRLMACMYAHQDKLSPGCERALVEAAVVLERVMNSLSRFAEACMVDIDEHCAQVPSGEGRLLSCLGDHRSELRPQCATAIEDVGLVR